jgi:hypothetical protein
MVIARQQQDDRRRERRISAAALRFGPQEFVRTKNPSPRLIQQLRRSKPTWHGAQPACHHAGGNFASLMAAGAVCHRPHPEIGTIYKSIFVARADRTDMRRGPGAEAPGS